MAGSDPFETWKGLAKRYFSYPRREIRQRWSGAGGFSSKGDGKPSIETLDAWLTRRDRPPNGVALTELMRIHGLSGDIRREVIKAWLEAFPTRADEPAAQLLARELETHSALTPPPGDPARETPLLMPTTRVCDGVVWRDIADDILHSVRVDIIGLIPLPLIAHLVERREVMTEPDHLSSIRYFTKPQHTIYSNARSADGHRMWQWWRAALTGMRNLLNMGGEVSRRDVRFHSFAYSSEAITDNCVIRCTRRSGDPVHTVVIANLGGADPEKGFVATDAGDNTNTYLEEWFIRLAGVARPIVVRDVDCTPAPSGDLVSEAFLQFEIAGLSSHGSIVPSNSRLEPVAIAILLAKGRHGTGVVLKRRSPLTANDDFGKLSLLSARVLEEDVAKSFGTTPPIDHDEASAIEELWVAAQCPTPFSVPLAAFVSAAQREVFSSTHLDIPESRFDLRGCHVVTREDNEAQLGFAVFVISLRAGPDGNEVSDLLGHNASGLAIIPVAELYSSNLPLNRLLLARQAWLGEHCFQLATNSVVPHRQVP